METHVVYDVLPSDRVYYWNFKGKNHLMYLLRRSL